MKLAEGFLTHDMDGERIMVAGGEMAQKFAGLVRANEAAAVILDCLKEDTDAEAIVKKMAEEYDAPEDVLRRDVLKVLQQLRSIGALDE